MGQEEGGTRARPSYEGEVARFRLTCGPGALTVLPAQLPNCPTAQLPVRPRRGMDTGLVHRVLTEPEQWFNPRPGRVVLQSRVPMGSPETVYLVRVVVDLDRKPPQVVTAYRTSKIFKYWRPGS